MRLLILSPWENDWSKDVLGSPKNYYLLIELNKHKDIEVDWVYIGQNNYKQLDNVNFLKFNDFKFNKDYDVILGFSYQFHNLALKLSKKLNAKYINKHFGVSINPIVKDVRNILVQIRYKKLFDCFRKQADFYILEEDGTNGKLMLLLFKVPSYKIRVNEQPKPDNVIFEPVYRRDKFINVGYCGAISKYKGEKMILEIFKQILRNKKLHLILLVKGFNKRILELSKLYDNLTILENFSYFQTYKFYSSIDFLINPVHYGNMTLPTVEAFSYGKPVIAFDLSLYTKIVHLKNGILVKPFDIKSFVNWTNELVNNRLLLEELSRNALETSKSFIKFSEYIKNEVNFIKSFS
ncbi:MAG: glycosyltransferase [candidate division WOR-3 bacterium]